MHDTLAVQSTTRSRSHSPFVGVRIGEACHPGLVGDDSFAQVIVEKVMAQLLTLTTAQIEQQIITAIQKQLSLRMSTSATTSTPCHRLGKESPATGTAAIRASTKPNAQRTQSAKAKHPTTHRGARQRQRQEDPGGRPHEHLQRPRPDTMNDDDDGFITVVPQTWRKDWKLKQQDRDSTPIDVADLSQRITDHTEGPIFEAVMFARTEDEANAASTCCATSSRSLPAQCGAQQKGNGSTPA